MSVSSLLLFKALADETRLRLAHILFHYELSVNELVQILGMGQSRVSRHLKILSESGLSRFRRDGLQVFYSAPEAGEKLEFLRAIMPFFPGNPLLNADLARAGQIMEERVKKTRQFFNAIAENWDDLNHEVLGDFCLANFVLAAMPAQCAVAVDLGCGTGEVLDKMRSRARRVIGVDGSAKMLDLCRARIGSEALVTDKVSLRIGELSHLPLADNEAGFACINLVLHHLARPEEIYGEIFRVLEPGGQLFIADFLRHDDESMRSRYGDHWLGFEPEKMARALESASFKTLDLATYAVGKGLSLFMIQATALPNS